MLKELRIKNFTIIDDLLVQFGPGLNVLTGETGAGKSIVVDAIGLILGDKAGQDMIRAGAKEAQIEASFDSINHPMLEELSIDSDDGIVERRNITAQGKGKIYVNDTAVSMQTASSLGRSLVDIHGQHEHQGLLKKENHLLFLDSFAGLTNDASTLRSLFNDLVSLRKAVAEMQERLRERGQRIDFLRFELNEIDAAALKQGERETIEEERAILLNLGKLRESSETAYTLLYDSDNACSGQLASVLSRLREMARIDRDASGPLELLESAIPLVNDAAIALRDIKEKYDTDPQKLDLLEERLELIKKLEKKYGKGVEAVLSFREKAADELTKLEHIDEQMGEMGKELGMKEKQLFSMARLVSEKRKSAAVNMERMLLKELHELGFQKAEFKIEVKEREAVAPNGIDDIEFLFSANPGEPPRPLHKVASGGELSRIMLALKCIEIEGHDDKPANSSGPFKTLIFDEVDAGIGGVTAQHVGKRLKNISQRYQVLCITHLAQIAAMADNHMKVDKIMTGDNVKVTINCLNKEERQEEIARMLGGKITEGAVRHAKELLGH